jgi:WS/DGAT/MGAT family acyltransferase
MKMDRDASFISSRANAHPRQLSNADAVFISVESPNAPSHVAGLTILDPSSSSKFGFERYLEILQERVELVARFKWKLFEPSLGLDRAYWVEDEDFDVADHVRRVAIPKPGNRAALAELAGFLHAQPLDRSRPLWECWWIEGLEEKRIATLLKIHHSLMDGQSGIGLSEILMDLSPEPVRDLQVPDEAEEPKPRRPTLWEVGRAALANGLRRPGAFAIHSRRALQGGLGRALDAPPEPAAPSVPRLAFNGQLSRQRSFAFASIPLSPLRDAKKHFDVTMNAVLLELVASSLRKGLIAHGDLPEEPVVGLCPVSLRQDGDQSFGNQISSMPVSLATNLEDAPGRLAAIHSSAEAAKRRLEGGAFETLAALGECLVPGVLRMLTRVAHGFPSLLPLPANLVISNVRGLPVPLYQAGARVEELYPISMLQVANGMNVTAVSHGDQVDFGFLVDSNLVRDPWIYANGIHAALRELEAAVASNSKTLEPEPASGRPIPIEPPSEEARPATRGVELPSPLDSPRFEVEPLNLQLMISELSHLRAPSRKGITEVEGANGDE